MSGDDMLMLREAIREPQPGETIVNQSKEPKVIDMDTLTALLGSMIGRIAALEKAVDGT